MKKFIYLSLSLLIVGVGLISLHTSMLAKETSVTIAVDQAKRLSDCRAIEGLKERELCFVDTLTKFNIKNINSFVREIELKNGFKGSCHTVLHDLADRYGQKYSKDALLNNANLDLYLCSGGFLHGLQESYAIREGVKGVTNFSLLVCGREDLVREASCLHGTGHAYSLADGSPNEIALECTKLTDALILKYTNYGYEKERVNFYVQCMEGYFMKRYNDQRGSFKDLTLNKVLESCQSHYLVAKNICITVYYRPYISMLMDAYLNPDFSSKVKTEAIFHERNLEMNQFCDSLDAVYRNKCFFVKGIIIFDRFNYNTDHTAITATAVFQNCKDNSFCYNGYFYTLLSPSAVRYPTKDYLIEFCRNEVCITERDLSIAFMNHDKDITRR